MRKGLLSAFLLFSIDSFSQIIYPGTPTKGTAEVVFDYSVSNCNTIDIPDVPARAFKDASGKINLIASHYTNWRMTGTSFTSLTKDCNPVMSSHQSTNAGDFDNNEWIMSTYTSDGIKVHALIHNEYVPCGNSSNCWYNAITYASSNDSGRTYTHTVAPSHLVAASPYKSPYPTTHAPFGIFGGSNIVKKDGYYYKMVQLETYLLQDWGAGLMRTNNLSDPTSWRGWDGKGFNVSFVNPYTASGYNAADKVLAPLSRDYIGKMCASLTYNTYFGKYMVVDYTVGEVNGSLVYGFYYALSADLITWSQKRLILQTTSSWAAGGSNYPSIIDHNDTTRNFERAGQTCYLYYTKWNSGTYDRDLLRIPVTFNKEVVNSFVVNSTTNTGDATPGDGICKTTGNVCTLRAALEEANARPVYDGYDTLALPITFSITGTGVKTITPSTYLPEILYPTDINGYTQTGANANTNNFDQGMNAVITVAINAANTGGAPALSYLCQNNRLRGIATREGEIYFNYEKGRSIGMGNNRVEGCFIGMSADGLTPYSGAVRVDNTNRVTIGGTTNAARNLIGGGVIIYRGDSNIVIGNYIGTTITGNASSTTGAHGVEIQDSSTYNRVGGSNTNERNLISGGNRGVSMIGTETHHNEVYGNYIGVARNGITALGNGSSGVNLTDGTHHNIIGKPGAANVICDNSNDEAGIWLDNTHDNTIQSNYIGTDASMTVRLGNGNPGQYSAGIMITADCSNKMIGGWNSNEGNVIAYNAGFGIGIYSNAKNGNAIVSNSIYKNADMAIDLRGDSSPEGNDNQDGDTGPNDFQNYPEITQATAVTNLVSIYGTFNSKPNATYKIQYFYNDSCDISGNGEGEQLIGTQTVSTNGAGNVNINTSFAVNVPVGKLLTATATDANNNTSEFSTCKVVDIATAIRSLTSSEVKVYPTFVHDYVYVLSEKGFNYNLYDQQGKLVLQGTSKTQTTSISVSGLSVGIYFLKMQGDTWVSQEKIVKE